MEFGEKLKKLRKEKNLTPAQVGKAVGITTRTYISYESNGRFPQRKEIYSKLAEILGCDTSYLMTDDEKFITLAAEKYGFRGKRQAENLIKEFPSMFSDSELSENDKDAVFSALQRAYVICKEDNKKYTRKDYRKSDV